MRKARAWIIAVLLLVLGCAGPFRFRPVQNGPPVAKDDVAITEEDSPGTFDVLANDGDHDGRIDPKTVTVKESPSHGYLSINAESGLITYTPYENFAGTDTFHYTVKDDKGAVSNDAAVTITVHSVNDFPVATSDNVITKQETTAHIDVLSNDTDRDSPIGSSKIIITENPSNGSVKVDSSTGMIVYTPEKGFFGSDMLKYVIEDDKGASSNIAEVRIAVEHVNAPPVAKSDRAKTKQKVPVTVDVLLNDTDPDGTIDPRTVQIAQRPRNGSSSIDMNTGAITYIPNPSFSGNDTFRYRVKDNEGASSNPVEVFITVSKVKTPQLPLGRDDVAITVANQAVSIAVLANDRVDEKRKGPIVVIVEGPKHGSAKAESRTRTIAYNPDTDFVGMDTIKYAIKYKGEKMSNTASVSIFVNEVNQAPNASNDVAVTDANSAVIIDVLANDTDKDGRIEKQTLVIGEKPAHGSAVVDLNNGTVTYSPDETFTGKDRFRYQVQDDDGALSNFAEVVVSVNAAVVVEEKPPTDPKQVLKKADQSRGNLHGITWVVVVNSIENKEQKDSISLEVNARGFDILAEHLKPPKYKGNKLLMLKGNMWFYRPGLSKAVPVSRRQKLIGNAAYGDVAATNYSEDYEAAIVGEEEIDGELCYVFDLQSINENTTYDRIKYWISKERIVGIYAEYFTVSGKKFKSAVMNYENRIKTGTEIRPFISKVVISNELVSEDQTILIFTQPAFKKLPDYIFDLNLLRR